MVLHNELGLEHDYNSDSPFTNDMLMLTNHAQNYLLSVFVEQSTFEIDFFYTVNLSMCYTVKTKNGAPQ